MYLCLQGTESFRLERMIMFKEIYEFMELDNRYEVDWLNGKYILRDISSNDIIELNYENTYTITKEYTKI